MDSNDDLAPSSLGLLPPPPPSPPSSSLPFQTYSTTSFSAPSRPIPIEIYNHILHFAFGRHLPPLPLENQLDEPPSLAPLLPLTLVSKGLRELVLPFLYYHVTIRQPESWIRLLDPTEGFLVGGGEEATRRRGWIKKLSFARDGFPVASWTPFKGQLKLIATPNMALLNYPSLINLEEVFIGDWRDRGLTQREVDEAFAVEQDGALWKDELADELAAGGDSVSSEREGFFIRGVLEDTRAQHQTLSLLAFLQQAHPALVYLSFDSLGGEAQPPSVSHSFSISFHRIEAEWFGDVEEGVDDDLSGRMDLFGTTFPSSRFNLDLALQRLKDKARVTFKAWLSENEWTKDEAGWWTRD